MPANSTVTQFVAIDAVAPQDWFAFEDWIDGHDDETPNVELRPDDTVIQMYTSGTTGRAKGVLLTHRSIATSIIQTMVCDLIPAGSRLQVAGPVYHVAAAGGCLAALAGGGSLYMHEDFVPKEVVRVLDEEAIEVTFLAPSIQMLLVQVPGVAGRKYSGLRRIIYGAAPMSERVLRQAMEVFGCDFCQAYGQTEGG